MLNSHLPSPSQVEGVKVSAENLAGRCWEPIGILGEGRQGTGWGRAACWQAESYKAGHNALQLTCLGSTRQTKAGLGNMSGSLLHPSTPPPTAGGVLPPRPQQTHGMGMSR